MTISQILTYESRTRALRDIGRMVDTEGPTYDGYGHAAVTGVLDGVDTVIVYPVARYTPAQRWQRPWWVNPATAACILIGLILSLSAGGTGPLWLAIPGLGLLLTSVAVLYWAYGREGRPW